MTAKESLINAANAQLTAMNKDKLSPEDRDMIDRYWELHQEAVKVAISQEQQYKELVGAVAEHVTDFTPTGPGGGVISETRYPVTVLAVAGNWAMVRRMGAPPYCCLAKELQPVVDAKS